jgi:hypothetical protein
MGNHPERTNGPEKAPLGAGQCGNGDVTGCNTGLAGSSQPQQGEKVGAEQAANAFRIATGGTSGEGPPADPGG